jgi:hypothetical protein
MYMLKILPGDCPRILVENRWASEPYSPEIPNYKFCGKVI